MNSSALHSSLRSAAALLVVLTLSSATAADDGPAVPASPQREQAEAWRTSFRKRARELAGVANGIKVQGRALMPEDHRRIADCERRADILRSAASTLRLALRGKALLLSAEEREQVRAALVVLQEPDSAPPSPRRGLRPLPVRPAPPRPTEGPDSERGRSKPLAPSPQNTHRAREIALEVELLKRRRERLQAELKATEAKLAELAAERRLIRHRRAPRPSSEPAGPGRRAGGAASPDDRAGFRCVTVERPSWCGLAIDGELTLARRAANQALLYSAAGAAGYRPTGVLEIHRAVDGLNLAPKGRMILFVESLKSGEEGRLPEGVRPVEGPAETRAAATFKGPQDVKPAWRRSCRRLLPLLGGVAPSLLVERFEPSTAARAGDRAPARAGAWSLEHRAAARPGRRPGQGGGRR